MSLWRFILLLGSRHGLAVALVLLTSGLAHAGEDEDHLLYKLQPRDTLLSLVSQYMQGSDAFAQIVKVNKISNPNVVPVGYLLKIPRQLIKHRPSMVTVTQLNCRTVSRLQNGTVVSVQSGDTLAEGDVLRIPAGCQLAVMLEDTSVLRMMSGAIIKFKTLRLNMLEKSPEVRLELLDGRIEIDVPRHRSVGDAPFEVLTPTSVAGVRGTEFRVGFDAIKRNGQVEVLMGVVGAQGRADRQEQRAHAGQGVAINANGQAQAVESLLTAPRFSQAVATGDGKDWHLQFDVPAQAKQVLLRRSEDASFSFFSSDELLDRAEVSVPDFSAKAIFQQWAAVSASGISGYAANYGLCKGYKRMEVWRCNIHINMTGLHNPHLRFERLLENGSNLVVLDQDLKMDSNDQLVLRGVPSGQYRWKLDYDLKANQRITLNGQFELIATSNEP